MDKENTIDNTHSYMAIKKTFLHSLSLFTHRESPLHQLKLCERDLKPLQHDGSHSYFCSEEVITSRGNREWFVFGSSFPLLD